MRTPPLHLAAALFALSAWCCSPGAFADVTSDLIRSLQLVAAPTPVKQRPDWRVPRKVMLLEFGKQEWAPRQSEFSTAAPETRVIVVHNMTEALAQAPGTDVLVGFNPEICAPQLLAAATQLRWIESLAAGVENCLAVPGLRQRGLLLTNMRAVDAAVIAEHAIALTLAIAHGLDVFAVDTAHARWSFAHGATTPMQSLEGKTLLVVGLGGIGIEVARRAYGLGMNVVATRDGERKGPSFVSHVGGPAELAALAKNADVIVSCVPLTPVTKGMFDAKFFALLKPTAIFVNISRGGTMVMADLTQALNDRRLAGAGLDVADPEPLPASDPLWRAPHVLVTPHISSRSDLPGEGRWIVARENMRRYARGMNMLNVVDQTRGY
ncbi:MAG TPA: D-2-hydroxyacid dehydrogenase [Steroidobacteraceae bacterium]|jgi:phosphoglycerate dehydrogenase-like enzyme|nr:D-2-hydroxyacid dehydrogenase [Steroidobacteraceae bacterium]